MAKQFKPETLCVQAGWEPKKGEPHVLTIYQSTTFKDETSGQIARLFGVRLAFLRVKSTQKIHNNKRIITIMATFADNNN